MVHKIGTELNSELKNITWVLGRYSSLLGFISVNYYFRSIELDGVGSPYIYGFLTTKTNPQNTTVDSSWEFSQTKAGEERNSNMSP